MLKSVAKAAQAVNDGQDPAARHAMAMAQLALTNLGIGIVVPLLAVWFLAPFGRGGIVGALALAAGGVVAARLAGPMYAAPRFALCALAAALLFRLVIR